MSSNAPAGSPGGIRIRGAAAGVSGEADRGGMQLKVLEARNLVRHYGKWRVVDGVNLNVRQGEVVGLLGPKEASIFRKMTVRENILAVLETLPLSKPEREGRCHRLLEELDLLHIADRRGYKLSGGERRRVEITRALVTEPSFMLLDEPFVGIDPIAVGEIQQNILRLKARGLGLLITDHSVRETLMATDRVYLMYEGKIRLEGNARELADHPVAREIYLGKDFQL